LTVLIFVITCLLIEQDNSNILF